MSNKIHQFYISLNAKELEAYFSGQARHVLARSLEGLSLQFPASALRKFIQHDGIHAKFQMLTDENNKLIRIEKIG